MTDNTQKKQTQKEERVYPQGFKKMIRDAHENTCDKCNSTRTAERNLELHHIKTWADDVAGRLAPLNLTVLCHDCHREIHGFTNATKVGQVDPAMLARLQNRKPYRRNR